MRNDDTAKIASAFLIGGLIGAGIALLYAPKSGRETRKDISRTAKNVKRNTIEFAEDTIESIDNFVDDVKDRASDLIERGADLTDGAKKEIVKRLENSQKAIEKQRKRLIEGLGL